MDSVDDISAYIIPPPPRAPPASVESTPIKRPLASQRKSSVSTNSSSASAAQLGISPKIASLQQKLANLNSQSQNLDEVEGEEDDDEEEEQMEVPPPPPPPRLTGIRSFQNKESLRLNLKPANGGLSDHATISNEGINASKLKNTSS